MPDVMTAAERQVTEPTCRLVSYDSLPGWGQDDLAAALHAFRQSAALLAESPLNFAKQPRFAGRREDWRAAVEASSQPEASQDPKAYFEKHFMACQICDALRPEGLFTGYFEPVVNGSRKPGAAYPVPVYGKPPDLVAFDTEERQSTGLVFGRRNSEGPAPYDSRQEIECGSLAGQGLELCWLDSWIEAFFMHIQGSGRVQFEDGTTLRLTYAAKSGLPYVAIGSVLLERGLMSREQLSMQSLMAWMEEHPAQSRELMWQNPSYIFFRELAATPENLGAVGAGKVNLTPQRSLAIDASYYLYGTPLWLETTTPRESPDGAKNFNRLMIAQDTGSAIRGALRGDVYWGWGSAASTIAGHMKRPGRMTALLPLPVARRLGISA